MGVEQCLAVMAQALKADEAKDAATAIRLYSEAAAGMMQWSQREEGQRQRQKLAGHARQCVERAEELTRTQRREEAVQRSKNASDRGDALKTQGKDDEAVLQYMTAADILLQYKQSEAGKGEPDSVTSLITRQIHTYVECAELLKSLGGMPSHTPAGKPPPAASSNPPSSPSPPPQPAAAHADPGNLRVDARKAAVLQDNPMASEELHFLRGDAGLVYGNRLPLWDDRQAGYPAVHSVLIGRGDLTPFTDASPPALSQKQVKHGGVWLRPAAFLPEGIRPRVVQTPVDPLDIVQSVVGNCSYVCSLTVAAAYERRFPNRKLITSSIFPQDASGRPGISPTGRYAVKLLINGSVRMVSIDDRIVASQGMSWVGGPRGGHAVTTAGHSPLCGHCASGDLWVSLLEKAFLKAFGASYEFGGSNSATDLYHLCGWIPEVVELGALSGAEKTAEWGRVYAAHQRGQVMMTAGTADRKEMPALWEEKLGLVANHAYSILDMFEFRGICLLKMMNPWRQHRWMGRYSHQDNKSWTKDLMAHLRYDRGQEDNGVFWIDWNDACKFFSRLSLSWLPHGFSSRIARHLNWQCNMLENNHFFRCAQYDLKVSPPSGGAAAVVWILLVRHLPKALPKSGGQSGGGSDPFITVHVMDTTGTHASGMRLAHAFNVGPKERWICNGVYKNSTTSVAKIAVPPSSSPGGRSYGVVVSSLQAEPIPHSLTVYTSLAAELSLVPAAPYPNTKALTGCWAKGSAGGRAGSANWRHNPQFRFVVREPGHIAATLEVVKQASVGLSVTAIPKETLQSQGARWQGRVDSIRGRVLKSGVYGPSLALIDSRNPQGDSPEEGASLNPEMLPVGVYTIVPCTYDAGMEMNFKLTLYSSVRSTAESLMELPAEGTGMHHTALSGSWDASNHTVAFRVYGFKEITCRMVVTATAIVTARLTLGDAMSTSQGVSEYLLPLISGVTATAASPVELCAKVPASQSGSFVIHCYTDAPLSVR